MILDYSGVGRLTQRHAIMHDMPLQAHRSASDAWEERDKAARGQRDAQASAATAQELVARLERALTAAQSTASRDADAARNPNSAQVVFWGNDTDGPVSTEKSSETCKAPTGAALHRHTMDHADEVTALKIPKHKGNEIEGAPDSAPNPSNRTHLASEEAPDPELLLLQQRLLAAAARIEDAVAVAHAAAAASAAPAAQAAAMSAALQRTHCLLHECASRPACHFCH
jgi:hypothetical protein